MQVSKGGKRKARGEEGEEASAGSKQAGPSRKAVKRAQGHTPSRKGPAHSHKGNSPAPQSHGTPLRHMNGTHAPSRLANSTHAADLENAAKAANSTPAAQVRFLLALVCHVKRPAAASSCFAEAARLSCGNKLLLTAL